MGLGIEEMQKHPDELTYASNVKNIVKEGAGILGVERRLQF